MSISSLQWVVGAFVATLGALMLVSPHQFAAAAYAPVSTILAWLGPGFLLAGAGLLAVATPASRFRYTLLAHLWSGAMLVILAWGFALSGNWIGTSNYGVLGLGTALAPLLAHVRTKRTRLNHPTTTDPDAGQTRGQAFSLLIGLATTVTGLLLLAMPTQFSASVYDLVRPYLVWYGLAFVAAGITLGLSQIGDVVPPRFGRWSALVVAGPFFLFALTVALPAHAWTGIAYYGGFGAALVVLAWTGPHLRRLDPGSLRARLALVLAAAAAVPVLILTPLYSHEEESGAISEQLGRQQTLASALAQDVADYVSLHQAAVTLLATQPGLLALSLGEQHLLLQSSNAVAGVLGRAAIGDGVQTYLVDATGRVIAHPDLDLVASFADLSDNPSVVALLSHPEASGSLRVAGPTGEVLASYAHVPGLGWGVVVELPSAMALAPTRAKLDLLFGGLLLVIGAAAGFGVVAAGWLSQPLVTLGAAVDGLAAGDDSAPLPAGGLTEIAGLAAAFGTMRARVIGHTADLLAANRELEALYRVGQTITAPLELDVVLDTIARCTAELLGTDSGAILLVEQATQTLTIQGAYGISERAVRDTRDRVGESIAGRVAQTGRPIIANDLPNNPLFFNPAAEQEGLLAIASVPLIVGDKTIGTLDVHSKTNRFAFDDDHIQVLQMLASQAASALENARLYQELRVTRDELEVRVHARTSELIAANEQLQQEIAERTEVEAALRRTEAQARRAEAQIQALNGDLERRVVQRTAELEAANKELEAFSYSVSHDLRAPLRAINGFSRILLEEHASNLEAEAQEYLELVRDNASQMGSLIDALLDFSRMSRQGLREGLVRTAEIVRDVLGDLASERQGRLVEVVIGELLPCRADPTLLKQLFVNLISNALKFTRGRTVAHVEIGCKRADDEVVYFVKDDGAGFDMRYAHKLFGVFQRLHRAEEYEGTGVGLAIVQRIVQRHGGRVWADGAPDRGATFFFTLAGQLNSPYQREEERSDDSDRIATRDAA